MRWFMVMCVVALACLFCANTATAANVSDQTLAVMGLSDMTKIDDAEGLEVRGLGYVRVSGFAFSWNPFGFDHYFKQRYQPYAFAADSASTSGAFAFSFGFAR